MHIGLIILIAFGCTVGAYLLLCGLTALYRRWRRSRGSKHDGVHIRPTEEEAELVAKFSVELEPLPMPARLRVVRAMTTFAAEHPNEENPQTLCKPLADRVAPLLKGVRDPSALWRRIGCMDPLPQPIPGPNDSVGEAMKQCAEYCSAAISLQGACRCVKERCKPLLNSESTHERDVAEAVYAAVHDAVCEKLE